MSTNKNILVIALLLFTTVFYGQRKPDKEKIKALKVAFITERLNLTSNEAQEFWPIYNAHEEKMENFRQRERTEIYSKLKDINAVSDTKANKLLQEYVALEAEKSKEQQLFLEELKTVISAKKIFLLLKSENGFKRRLLKQYRQNRGGGN